MRFVCSTNEQCQEVHHTMAKRVMNVLECARAVWMAVHGTLLGLMRNNSLSPNDVDMDVDLAVSESWFKDISTSSNPIFHTIKAMGYHLFVDPGSDDTIIRVCLGHGFPGVQEDTVDRSPYYDHYKFLDIFKLTQKSSASKGNEVVIFEYEYPEEHIFPLRSIDFNDSTIPIPAHPEFMLTKLYGNWTVVLRTLHGNFSKSKA